MDPVEAVARALCEVDGNDPEQMRQTGGVDTVVREGAVVIEPIRAPYWRKYETEARRFMAAHKALTDANIIASA